METRGETQEMEARRETAEETEEIKGLHYHPRLCLCQPNSCTLIFILSLRVSVHQFVNFVPKTYNQIQIHFNFHPNNM